MAFRFRISHGIFEKTPPRLGIREEIENWALDRLLDPDNDSVTLQRAASAVSRRLQLQLV